MGDFLAFTSGLMNDAVLGFQILLSVFFLANDLTLCYQYYYYNSVYPHTYTPVHISNNDDNDDDNTKQIDAMIGTQSNAEVHDPSSVAIQIKRPLGDETGSLSSTSGPSYDSVDDARQPGLMKTVLAGAAIIGNVNGMMNNNVNAVTASSNKLLGLVLAWGCTCFYVASRCPQLLKNYQRKSVDGISPLLFGAALGGNLTYTLCIVTSCNFVYANNRHQFFMSQLPYILGSSGTIVFDIGYFYQRYIYRDSGRNTSNMPLEDWDDIVVRVEP